MQMKHQLCMSQESVINERFITMDLDVVFWSEVHVVEHNSSLLHVHFLLTLVKVFFLQPII